MDPKHIIRKHRRKSSIYILRRFHNWIKRKMLNESSDHLRTTYNMKNLSLLDLAVGRGGDLNKWYNDKIYHVVGIDIDDKSINGPNGAKDRYRSMVKNLEKMNRIVPKYNFYVYDLSDSDNIKHIDNIVANNKFDIVSCQFALHYFFKNEISLDTLIKIVSRYIKKNGMFIGTTMDGLKVNEMFMYGNKVNKKLFYLENKTEIMDTYDPYGNEYIVSLGERQGETHYFADKPSIEYMVDMEELKRVCAKYNLIYIGIIPFERWHKKYIEEGNEQRLEKNEAEFSFLNFSFVFMSK